MVLIHFDEMFNVLSVSHTDIFLIVYILYILPVFFFIFSVAVFCVKFENQHTAFYALLLYHNKMLQFHMHITLYQLPFCVYVILYFT